MNVFIIAGEASGDNLGAAIMKGLTKRMPEGVVFTGIGGAAMREQGLESLFPMEQISLMGIVEILRKYRSLKSLIEQTVEEIVARKADVLISIDLPEFNLRVARQVKARSAIRTVHYVAPTVWAWRPGRAAKMAPYIDQVLALFPFEPPYMHAAGMHCDFVGHPVVNEPQATVVDLAAFRSANNLGAAPVLLVLPGSRHSEVVRLLPVFGASVKALLAQDASIRILVSTVPAVAEQVGAAVSNWPGDPILLMPELGQNARGLTRKQVAFGVADVALAASGTVSLELAAAGTPMVIAYDMGWLSRQIISRMLQSDSVTLVNLISETRAVPEFIGRACNPSAIVPALRSVLSQPEMQNNAMRQTMLRLGLGGIDPGLRAADAVLKGLGVHKGA